jgi:hypothetical protein
MEQLPVASHQKTAGYDSLGFGGLQMDAKRPFRILPISAHAFSNAPVFSDSR